MLYPSIQQLTNENINRYMLVIATAKCARHVTQTNIESREDAERKKEIDRFSKDARNEITNDSVNDKAVSVVIEKLHQGQFKIIV